MVEYDRRAATVTEQTVTIENVRDAARRISGHVRHTPVIEAVAPMEAMPCERLDLKLECLQVTGSFKPRGAISRLSLLADDDRQSGLVTASGGNHGLAVAYAGWSAGIPATVYVPRSTPQSKIARIEAWKAQVLVEGDVWDDANAAAQDAARKSGAAYIHPFADSAVIAGQGTIGVEILDQTPDIDTVIVAIGGGGLIAGVAATIKALRPDIRVIGVDPEGAPTHFESRRAGKLVTLGEITTVAGTLAPRRSEAINFDIISQFVDDIVLVNDDEMRTAARWLWFEMAIAAELSGAAALAALRGGKIQGRHVCALVCGAGTDGQ
jgi:threonine dehydratase